MRKMRRLEEQCRSDMEMADAIFGMNEDRHSREECQEECRYLQDAAGIRAQMARISVGREKAYQQEKLRELNSRIAGIVKELDPDLYRRMMAQSAPAGGSKAAAPGAPPSAVPVKGAPVSSAPSSQKKDAKDNEDAEGWYLKTAPKQSFDDVVGMKKEKAEMQECMTMACLNKLRAYLHLDEQIAFVYAGPPGCGKSYFIGACIHELMQRGYKCISVKSSDILNRYVGEAEKKVTRLFQAAQEQAPCVIFIDEIDGLCRNRNSPNLPAYAGTLTTAFLTGFNEITKSDRPIIFLAATNYPDLVDSALLDRAALKRIGLPDGASRADKLRRDLSGILRLRDLSFDEMGDLTENYDFRDLDKLIGTIKMDPLRNAPSDVRYEELDAADAEKLDVFQDQIIGALETGAYTLDRDTFTGLLQSCPPGPKGGIL